MTTEFVKQTLRENLARTLVPHIADGLWSVYDNAKTACLRNKQPEMTLQTFQNLLTRIPQWTDEVLNKEVERIEIASKCDYLDDLLLGVFVSYIRAFASMQQSDKTHVDVHFDRPSVPKFIHGFYKLAARKSWSQAYLFKTIGVSSEQQARNRRDIETMLESCMNEVVDGFIPWRDISKAYFQARDTATSAPPPATPAPAPPPTPAPPVTFGEPEVHEFEDEDEEDEGYDSEDEDRPKISVGEEIALSKGDIEGDADSVDTATELEQKLNGTAEATVSLNL
jgi:hypothetical protein